MIFPFKDKDGYNLGAGSLPLCPFNQKGCSCRALDCAMFEVCYDGINGYCGLTQGMSTKHGARVPSFERGRLP